VEIGDNGSFVRGHQLVLRIPKEENEEFEDAEEEKYTIGIQSK
jgi:hypothetical protein